MSSHISRTIWVLYLSVRWYSTSLPDFSVPTSPALRRMIRLWEASDWEHAVT